jgi:hypothetical protein
MTVRVAAFVATTTSITSSITSSVATLKFQGSESGAGT